MLSLLLTVSSNPHRSLSFLIPDSIDPWVYSPPQLQWNHGQAARRVLAVIPDDASAAANTPLVPLLARREVLVRFPFSSSYLDRAGDERPVDWIAVDLNLLERYSAAFRGDWRQLKKSRRWLEDHRDGYAVKALEDGVLALERNGLRDPKLEARLDDVLAQPLPGDPRDQTKTMPPTG